MGAVYRALDGQSGTEVALKQSLDLEHDARFEAEARLLASLSHPRVVKILDHFTQASGRYLVMELVRGGDLATVLRAHGTPGLPVHDAVDYVSQACEALQYVHDQQIVHRDVKPQNLIVSERGVVLVDFGIARVLEEEQTGTVGIGTPRFMAPEVFSNGTISVRTDVFGVAATLWNLVAGRPPVYGESSLSDVAPDVTPQLQEALGAGLELKAERRTASVEAFARALGASLELEGGQSLAHSLEGTATPATLMEGIVRTAAGVFGASASSICLVDDASSELVYQSAWGAGARQIVGVRLAPGTGLAGRVVQTGAAEAVPDCRSDPRFAAAVAAGTGYVPRTMLVVPLTRGRRAIGALSCLDRRDGRPYGAEDFERGALFAELVVTALDLVPGVGTLPGLTMGG
jgi:hypothetical protein